MIRFYCTHCGVRIETEDEHAGSESACPKCSEAITVPKRAAESPSDAGGPASAPEAPEEEAPPPFRPRQNIVVHEVQAPAPQRRTPAPPPPPAPARRAAPLPKTFSPAPNIPPVENWDDDNPRARFLPPPRPMGKWVGLGVFLAWLIGVYLSFNRPGYAHEQTGIYARGPFTMVVEGSGMLLGGAVIALVVSLAIATFLALFRQSFRRSLAGSFAVTVVLVMMAGVVGLKLMPKATMANGLASNQLVYDALVRKILDEALPPDDSRRTATTSPAKLAKVRVVQQGLINDIAALKTEYATEVMAAGGSTVLTPDRILADQDFSESRAILLEMREIVSKFRGRAQAMLDDYPTRLADAGFDLSEQARLSEIYKQGVEQLKPKFEEVWRLEMASVDQVESILGHLESTQGSWQVRKGSFTFDRQSDLERYLGLFDDMQKIGKRLMEIQSQSQAVMAEQAQELNLTLPE